MNGYFSLGVSGNPNIPTLSFNTNGLRHPGGATCWCKPVALTFCGFEKITIQM